MEHPLVRRRIRHLEEEVHRLKETLMALANDLQSVLTAIQALKSQPAPVETDVLSTQSNSLLNQIQTALGLPTTDNTVPAPTPAPAPVPQ